MSELVYKYIEPPKDEKQATEFMKKDFSPLLQEYWRVRGEKKFHKPLEFHVLSFMQMWMMNSLMLIVAYDGDKAVGILVGIKYSSLYYAGNAVNVEFFYGHTPEIEQGMVQYMCNIIPFMSIDDVSIVQGDTEMDIPLKRVSDYVTHQYVRE